MKFVYHQLNTYLKIFINASYKSLLAQPFAMLSPFQETRAAQMLYTSPCSRLLSLLNKVFNIAIR